MTDINDSRPTTIGGPRIQLRYAIVFWLFVLSTAAYLARNNISIAAVSISREFGLSKIELGWVFSAFLIGYAAFQIPAGWLAVTYGPRRVLTVGMLCWCCLSALIVFVSPNFGNLLLELIAIRFALGLSEALMYPAANQFTAYWIPMSERAKANGWIFAGVGAGAGIAPPLITLVMVSYGWRASFWLCAGIVLAAGAIWYILARDRPEQHPLISSRELTFIKSGIPTKPARETAVPWALIFSSKNVWILTLSYFSFGYITYIFLNWFFIYLAEVRNLNLSKSAVYSMMPFIAMTVCCLVGGVINDWLSKNRSLYAGRCLFSAAALLLCAVFLVLGSEADSPLIASIVLAGGAGALYLSQSSYWAVSADIAGRDSGIVSGLMNMGCQIAGAITASATPLIAQHFGWNAAFYVAAGFAVLGALAWLFIDPTRPIEKS